MKKAIYFVRLAHSLKMSYASQPCVIYHNSQPWIDIVSSRTVSKRVKHMAVLVAWIYKKVVKEIICLECNLPSFQPADLGTKSQSAPVLFQAMDYATGVRFYPPEDSEHAH